MTAPRTLTRYKAWADRMIFDAVAALPEEETLKPRPGVFRNMVHTLNHIYVIDRVFQAHLEGREHGYTARNTRECPSLGELRSAQEEIDRWYVDFYDAMPEKDLDEVIAFTFIGGGQGAMTRGDILLHLVNHTTYHRGNVASMIYQIPGRTPPTTDLPVYLRDAPR